MRLRWTLTLIVINLILIWLVAGGLVKPATRRGFEAQVSTFLPLQKADWDYLSVSTDEGGWTAQRDSWGRWWLKSPVEWPGRYERFSKMISFLTTLKIESAFSASQLKRVGQSLMSYGLEKPQGILEIGSQGKTESYKIGSATPLGEKLYVLSERNDEIWVVSRELLSYIDPAYEPYKADGFFPFDIVELENVSVQLGDESFKLERKSNTSSWQLVLEDQKVLLKQGAWERYLDELGQQTPSEFVELDAAQQGLKVPAGRLIFKTLYGRRALLIGGLANTQQRWVQWEGSKNAFTLPQSLLDGLKPENFVGKSLLDAPIQQVLGLSWKSSEGSFVLQKTDDGWRIGSGDQDMQPADETTIKEYLIYLLALEGEPFFKEPIFLSSAPLLTLQTSSQSTAYRFASDYLLAADGQLHYRFGEPFSPPSFSKFVSKAFIEKPESDLRQALWDSKALEPSAQAALEALLVHPQARSILKEVPNLESSHTLELVWADDSRVELTVGQYRLPSTISQTADVAAVLASDNPEVSNGKQSEGDLAATQSEDSSAVFSINPTQPESKPAQLSWVIIHSNVAYEPESAWIALFENLK